MQANEKGLPPRMNPEEYEKSVYNFWLENKLFHADENSKKEPFSIVIPPPNVTGSLHMGHALDETLQDILARFKRMKGFEVLWLPGTDHAGIATQNVVEKLLAKEGKSRHDLGREAFVERVWQQKRESGSTIMNQIKALGASCDWDRERFTLDEGLSKAVRHVFSTLYKEGLIYRSNYIVNWCPRCHTALSDVEVEFKDKPGFLYHFKYFIEDSDDYVEIATTRPETYFGDTAVAVHPEDERYTHLVGKNVILPIINRKIPIIADSFVERDFGSGCVKITPAHDPADFQVGKRHNLEEIVVIDENANMVCGIHPDFDGLSAIDARKLVIERFEEMGLMIEQEAMNHNVGHCYRCDSVIEPRVSLQWFVRMEPLAKEAVKAVEEGRIKLIPKTWENTFFEWMNNIRDWCISRQIWWGHRVPAYHCADCSHITVSENEVRTCEKCGSKNILQDEDVLDTWFSSGLWPFSTMGFPEKTKTLEKFYPTSTLVTGFDILFFWVARMMMMGIKFMGEVPFKDVYLHALVRDKFGNKMSKTRGNVIDPLGLIGEYGADALRFTLAIFETQGRDIKMNTERVEGYRNFINKIWNASRFILHHLDENKLTFNDIKKPDSLADIDLWILMKMEKAISKASKSLDNYNYSEPANILYQFFWMTFCDWYLELVKDRLASEDSAKRMQVLYTLTLVLKNSLIALHPFIPFVTEYIFQKLTGEKSIMYECYPDSQELSANKEEEAIDTLLELITLIRNIRGENNISPALCLDTLVKVDDEALFSQFNSNKDIISKLGKVAALTVAKEIDLSAYKNVAKGVSTSFAVYIPLDNAINKDEEIARLNKEKQALMKDINLYGGKLANEGYLAKAPAHIIEKDKKILQDAKDKLAKIEEMISNLQ